MLPRKAGVILREARPKDPTYGRGLRGILRSAQDDTSRRNCWEAFSAKDSSPLNAVRRHTASTSCDETTSEPSWSGNAPPGSAGKQEVILLRPLSLSSDESRMGCSD